MAGRAQRSSKLNKIIMPPEGVEGSYRIYFVIYDLNITLRVQRFHKIFQGEENNLYSYSYDLRNKEKECS